MGFCPRERITVPNSLVVMVPSPSLSNSENASLNSAICSSVSWSALKTPEFFFHQTHNYDQKIEKKKLNKKSDWILRYFSVQLLSRNFRWEIFHTSLYLSLFHIEFLSCNHLPRNDNVSDNKLKLTFRKKKNANYVNSYFFYFVREKKRRI